MVDIRGLVRPRRQPAWLVREVGLAREEIREGRFQRSMALLTTFAAIVSGFEAYAQHQRGAFANWLMWTPIWLTLPTTVVAAAALLSKRVARLALPFVAAVALLDGLVGFAFHIRGILRLPGGFKLGQYNVVMGPPIFAPLLVCSVGIMGLFAGFLRREVIPLPRQGGNLVSRLLAALPWSGQKARLQLSIEEEIAEGRFQQLMALAATFLTILAGGEVYFEHLRGSFNQRYMWIPVWATGPMVGTCVAAVFSRSAARLALPFAAIGTFFVGLLGFVLHLRGIWRMPGGLTNLRFSVTLGPPLFAPLLFTAAGLLGFIAVLLRREGRQ
ncbi:MAG: hypothetical protein M0Z94_12415 [Dehalococcoidales bacterium]|nr:hypothetical protein [Dehalococcoidales bacterium]